ncbi:serine/threonine-protein kinase PCRK1 [Tanacetum coccineum]
MVWWKSRHAFDMVSIDAFKTGKKHPDVRYVLSSVIASICMFVRLLMSDDAAIVMLPGKSGPTITRHLSCHVGGAVGYAASEYVQTDRLTAKSDVWSSGAVLE